MDSAVAGEESGEGPFVAGPGPGFAACLTREWADAALVGEAVAVFVSALAAGVVAVQPWSSGSASDGEFGGAPCARPMCWARLGDDWHLLVVRHGCHTVPSAVAGAGSRPRSPGGVVVVPSPRQSSVTKPASRIVRDETPRRARPGGRVTSQTIHNAPDDPGRVTSQTIHNAPDDRGAGYVTDDSQGAETPGGWAGLRSSERPRPGASKRSSKRRAASMRPHRRVIAARSNLPRRRGR